ncbi:MAG TPA: YihY/virulence factor BrkB family protein [Anaerolineae bacterium]
MRSIIDLLKETFEEWGKDKGARLAAALAYYTIFSIAPLLIIIIAVAGLVFGPRAVQGQLVGQIQGVVGKEGATLIQTMLANASKPSAGIIATVIGIVTLLLGASGLFTQLQDSLNTVWEVAPAPGRKIWEVLLNRLMTFVMVLTIGLLMIVSLVVSSALSALGGAMAGLIPVSIPVVFWQLVDLVVSFGVMVLLFTLIYKLLPDVRVGWGKVAVGAAFTSLLFTIGKFLIGLYLGHSSAGSAYGAAGSLVVLLLWIYYSSQILFLGAEFTKVYTLSRGAAVEPIHGTIRMTQAARVAQGLRPSGRLDTAPRAQAGKPPADGSPPGIGAAAPADRPRGGASVAPRAAGPKTAAAAAAGAVLLAVVAVLRFGRRA